MRSCGECIACCTYLKIVELDKPGMAHCAHVALPILPLGYISFRGARSCGDNCTAHGTPSRPPVCESYSCLWLQGHGDEGDRPDLSMMLFDRTKHVGNAIEAKPLAEEVADADALIDRMSRSTGMCVVVLDYTERRVRRIAGRPVA